MNTATAAPTVEPLDPNSDRGRAAEAGIAALITSVRARRAREAATALSAGLPVADRGRAS